MKLRDRKKIYCYTINEIYDELYVYFPDLFESNRPGYNRSDNAIFLVLSSDINIILKSYGDGSYVSEIVIERYRSWLKGNTIYKYIKYNTSWQTRINDDFNNLTEISKEEIFDEIYKFIIEYGIESTSKRLNRELNINSILYIS